MERSILSNEPQLSTWEKIKLYLVIAGVIFSLVLFVAMMFEGTMFNFDCFLIDFLSFECNRWNPTLRPVN
ncbi:MAG: hypothetical protein HOB79_07670 [Rhodospirillaceae bacterium]|jgi:hypothetical protein|nr:hypothetical protein [Rhodospirillaceae bacterium]